MEWPIIINEILWMEAITQRQLCGSLKVTPATINSLKQGRTLNPKYNLGSELVKRHKLLRRQQAENRKHEDDIARYRKEHVKKGYQD